MMSGSRAPKYGDIEWQLLDRQGHLDIKYIYHKVHKLLGHPYHNNNCFTFFLHLFIFVVLLVLVNTEENKF